MSVFLKYTSSCFPYHHYLVLKVSFISSEDIGSFIFLIGVDCVSDNGATRLLVDGVGTLNVRSDRYMNRSLDICLILLIFSSIFSKVAKREEV